MTETESLIESVRAEFRLRVRTLADSLLTDTFITYIAMLRERNLVEGSDAKLRDIIVDEWAAQLSAHGVHARELLDQARATGVDSLFAEVTERAGEPIDVRAEVLIAERQIELRAEAADRDAEEALQSGSDPGPDPDRVDPRSDP